MTIVMPTSARAHEIGTTQVDVMFRQSGAYAIEVRTDPDSLAHKLLTVEGQNNPPHLSLEARDRAIREGASAFLARAEINFDGIRSRPAFSYQPPSTSDPAAKCVIHLNGSVPSRARSFTWSYGLTYSSYALSVHHEGDANADSQWIEAEGVSKPVALRARAPVLTRRQVAWQYLHLGFTHILPKGLDHILFVLGLFLLSARLKPILAQVTTFTIAHSITLGLTIYGLVSLSPKVVEPMIALSICYVAIENLFVTELKPWRLALVFAFGLLHGMGFAGVLREMGLPRSEFLTALVTFNVGVELGQLTVISIAFLLVSSWARKRSWYRRGVVIPASTMIAVTGLFWTMQRIFF